MKLERIQMFNKIQRTWFRRSYRDWNVKNTVYFQRFMSLQQGEMTVDEYYDKFSWLCRLVENEGHYCISFIRGLRPSIFGNMKECRTKYEARREAIRIERMLNRSHMEISKPFSKRSGDQLNYGVEKAIQDSSQFNATLDQFAKQMQDMMAQMIALLQEQKQETSDSTINSGEVTDGTPTKDSTSDELEDKETKLSPL